MAVQHWLTRYHTGVAAIDILHEALFDRMDDIYSDIIAQAGQARIAQKVVLLTGQVITHLDEEEAEMRKEGFAGLEAHAASHKALRSQLSALAKRAESGAAVGTDVLDAMNQYFTVHIKQFDLAWAKAAKK